MPFIADLLNDIIDKECSKDHDLIMYSYGIKECPLCKALKMIDRLEATIEELKLREAERV